jgi:hypothetical protein
MSSLLDDIDITLANGDLEVFRRWVESKLESKDKQIAHLLRRIQKLETTCNILETAMHNKVDKVDFDEYVYQTKMHYEN